MFDAEYRRGMALLSAFSVFGRRMVYLKHRGVLSNLSGMDAVWHPLCVSVSLLLYLRYEHVMTHTHARPLQTPAVRSRFRSSMNRSVL